MKHIFLLSLIFHFGLASQHGTELCNPPLTRQDLFDLAVTSGVKVLVRQVESLYGDQPIPSSLMVHVTTIIAKNILAGKSIRFILKMLFVSCKLNKPLPNEKKPQSPVETAHICLGQLGKDECYPYKNTEEGDFSIEIP
ncbi:uncharacterized protein LOC108094765 [Drosophila ficusphila]|uniref:uncharacterized protein LOC108094765 n=1 Tax=Drosophila ficusphila TaxID=30025 RepID=UPI0007E5E4EC|nr:uncharacterized protein LOC108094765 [Drosophila ficusphila]